MSRPLAFRLLILLVAAAALVAVAWWGGLLGDRPSGSQPGGAAALQMDEAAARRLLPRLNSNDKIQYDPVAIVVPRPGYSMVFEWPEHPDGRFTMSTNAMGFREDAPTLVDKHGVRILVGGDSHPFGLLNNAESFTNLLEQRLNAEAEGESYEAINVSVSGTGPYEYLGSLCKHLYLQPDLFVAVLFTGNDFKNALRFSDFLSGRETEPLPEEVKALVANAPQPWWEPMGQSFNQAFHFHHRPQDGEVALTAAVDRFLDMARLCAQEDVAFVAVVLPTKPDVDLDHDRNTVSDILATLRMSEDDYGINRRLSQRFAAALSAEGVEVVDLFDVMRARKYPLYWAKDHHLGVAGHELVAEELLAPVRRLLAKD